MIRKTVRRTKEEIAIIEQSMRRCLDKPHLYHFSRELGVIVDHMKICAMRYLDAKYNDDPRNEKYITKALLDAYVIDRMWLIDFPEWEYEDSDYEYKD